MAVSALLTGLRVYSGGETGPALSMTVTALLKILQEYLGVEIRPLGAMLVWFCCCTLAGSTHLSDALESAGYVAMHHRSLTWLVAPYSHIYVVCATSTLTAMAHRWEG
jgi:hypothetical protein